MARSVCGQVPLFFDSDPTTRTTRVRASQTADWGEEAIIDWWCTEQEEAFSAERPVYVSMEAEMRRVCGDDVYKELAAYCRARQRARTPRRLALLPIAP